jgi:hypothetical protein
VVIGTETVDLVFMLSQIGDLMRPLSTRGHFQQCSTNADIGLRERRRWSGLVCNTQKLVTAISDVLTIDAWHFSSKVDNVGTPLC